MEELATQTYCQRAALELATIDTLIAHLHAAGQQEDFRRVVPLFAPLIRTCPRSPGLPKIALLLVLGHHFERLVRDGIVKDYADIGRRTGLTRARVCQIVNLTLLAPDIQEAVFTLVLTEQSEDDIHERSLRRKGPLVRMNCAHATARSTATGRIVRHR